MKCTRPIFVLPALLVLAFVLPARADGPSTSNLRTDWWCPRDCRDNLNTCRDAATEVERLCSQAACTAEQDSVSQACQGHAARSQGCFNAQGTLRKCVQPCSLAFRTALISCNAETRACYQRCPQAAGLFTKDPACVTTCSDKLGTCSGTADDQAKACRDNCSTLVGDAQTACQPPNDPASDTCKTALRAAHDCLEVCDDALEQARKACLNSAQDCVAACPTPTPTPGS
jgi:hypothetical protein